MSPARPWCAAAGRLARPAAAALAVVTLAASACSARVLEIPATFRVGPPRVLDGDGLTMRFKDLGTGCSIALCKSATDTVTVQTTTFAAINFLLNTGTTIGPFNHGGSYFGTRWDGYLDIRVPGDYVFAMQVDDNAEVAIGDSVILRLDGGNWFTNVRSDTVRFAFAGSYPFRAYYADCQPCCRGFRFGGMGPAGSGLMAFDAAFDFNTDLGPCCTFGSNGPGVSLVPAPLFYRTPPSVSVDPGPAAPVPGAVLRSWVAPNPTRGIAVLAIELAREQRVWAEIYDATGRLVASLAAGESHTRGIVRWPWSPGSVRAVPGTGGTYFYRVRTEDGASASGGITVVR